VVKTSINHLLSDRKALNKFQFTWLRRTHKLHSYICHDKLIYAGQVEFKNILEISNAFFSGFALSCDKLDE